MKIRFTIRRLMVAVALVAVFLAATIWLGENLEATRRPALPASICSHSGESDPVEATPRFPWHLARQRLKAEAEDAMPPGAQETPP